MTSDPIGNVELLKLQLEVWKEAVSTSKHFTEMSVRTRQLGLTFVVAAFAVAITLLSQYPSARISIPLGQLGYDIHIAGLIIASSAAGLFVTKLLDIKVYHRMLRGSVAFTEEIERKILRSEVMGTERGLAETISYHSRSKRSSPSGGRSSDRKHTSAEAKIKIFYNWSMGIIVMFGIVLTYVTLNTFERKTVINQRIEFSEPAKPVAPQKR